jgi:ketosteroid isomerase-like protein
MDIIRGMNTLPRLVGAALLAAAIVLPVARSTHAAPPRATADALIRLERDFMMAAAERGATGYMSYYAADAVEVPNGGSIIRGKPNIARTMGFLDDANNRLIWTPVGADISASRDLGYTYGTYELHSRDKDGNPKVAYGKYTTVWKKQTDGTWKVVLDMGNTSPEPKN